MANTIRRWLTRPVDYAWTVHYFETNTALGSTRVLIGLSCLLFSVLYVVAGLAPPTAPTGAALTIVLVNAVGTAGVGLAWIRGPWPSRRMSTAFVVYADVGLSVVLLSLSDPLAVLPCTILFGVASSYVATFHTPRVFAVHHSLTVVVCVGLFVRAICSESVLGAARTSLAVTYGLLIVMVLFLAPISIYRLQFLQRGDVTAAYVDPLTGLRNRRGLTVAAGELLGTRNGLVAVVIDIDRFKSINDRFGHHHGDLVIRRTADTIDEMFPSPSITARTGGEEFAVVTALPMDEVLDRARRLRSAYTARSDHESSLSIGVAREERVVTSHGVEVLLICADRAMYSAKADGGDAVVGYGTLT
ncbi:GGDEF domain-containing protein [Rhodococcus sp. MEB041]|uniref:GGDEF domain-containing protein n=1 Tax=Rhodococcus sp. MEB041 TaxID=3040323 RepID=UPI00254D07A9|nr:GGDEF domain-containing protein [Rhodococcus sp. MEB041]